MTDRTYEVGDVVAWAEVPDGALVFDPGDENWPEPAHALRLAGRGRWVHEARVTDWTLELEDWPWQAGAEQGQGAHGVTLVALNLRGDESADELCRLAEQFEKRSESRLERIQAALVALHAGDRPGAREQLLALWHELADDAAARCVLAHYLADTHDDPLEVLRWDERALQAAEGLTDAALKRLHPNLSLREFYPSLHLNLGEARRVVGDLAGAGASAEQALAAARALADDGYGQFIRAGIRRLLERVSREA